MDHLPSKVIEASVATTGYYCDNCGTFTITPRWSIPCSAGATQLYCGSCCPRVAEDRAYAHTYCRRGGHVHTGSWRVPWCPLSHTYRPSAWHPAHPCAHCSRLIPAKGGNMKLYCSTACRRAAYKVRRAGQQALTSVG